MVGATWLYTRLFIQHKKQEEEEEKKAIGQIPGKKQSQGAAVVVRETRSWMKSYTTSDRP